MPVLHVFRQPRAVIRMNDGARTPDSSCRTGPLQPSLHGCRRFSCTFADRFLAYRLLFYRLSLVWANVSRTADMPRFRPEPLSGSDCLNWRAPCRSMHYIEQYAPSQDASRGIRL